MAETQESVGDSLATDSATQTGNAKAPVNAPRTNTPVRAGHLPLSLLIDLYLSEYRGRDSSRIQRLAWWSTQLGPVKLEELSDDHVHTVLERLRSQPSCFYAGKDATGKPIYKAKTRRIAPATVNRYAAALSAVVTWAIKKRIAPRGYVHPCRTVEREAENNEQTRFLSENERNRLLDACRLSSWPRLHLLVLMALTTGARKGELMALRWRDIELERSLAYCGRTKNGDPKALPLVPGVVTLLEQYRSSPASFVFCSPRAPDKAYAFEAKWKQALREARLRNFRFHDLRHTCASILAQNGATLLEIGDVLGHRQLQVTKRYSHLTTSHKSALINRVLGELK